MSPVRAVLFDYGHTLVDFKLAEENLLACYTEVRRILEAQAQRAVPEAHALVENVSRRVAARVTDSYQRRELEELDMVALFDEALVTVGVQLPRDLVRQIAVMEHRALISNLAAPDENIDVLRQLQGAGLKLGLVSNATLLPDLMHEDIERLGIAAYMDHAVFSSEVGVRKPHPAIFRTVLDVLGAAPEETIFVGDRVLDDIGGAQAVGMRGVLTRQYRQEDPEGTDVRPDRVIDRLEDLVPFVLGLAAPGRRPS